MAASTREQLIQLIVRLSDDQIKMLPDVAIAIESKPDPVDSLEEMLARVTPETLHGEIDWGPPVGKERFWEEESD